VRLVLDDKKLFLFAFGINGLLFGKRFYKKYVSQTPDASGESAFPSNSIFD